ncbi:Apoptosis-inducing factor 2 [Tolypocladium capitatum]|uniref:Apoptosis-inducing factor 2 n=1 Tax=Tolypocladium capitatum TaxID=45235 RepID=A0A2K3Q876_9HYPO|nr:Apoptosis-inducing factor 2 [Tolypocladium capitatum]
MPKTVVVLGGSLGGLAVTHRLLKYTLPHEPDVKVVLVSKNSHFYWNIASVRAVIPRVVRDEELLQPIAPGLAQYPPGSVEFVVGAATGLDPQAKTVRVATAGAERGLTYGYDYLVVATGADAAEPGMPWKAAGTHDELVASLRSTAARIGAASHVVVAGGGPTGVEVSAEIKYEFPAKTVVLLSAGAELVGGDATAGRIERELGRLGVDVRKGIRAARADDDGAGKTRLTLSSGEELLTDLFLPTTGLVPNTAFLPADFLTEGRYVDVDECMRVRAAQDVWAIGDAVSKPRASYLNTDGQAAGVARNIGLVLQGKDQQVVKDPPVDIFICTTGRGRGAGRLGPVPIPSLVVWAVKGRTLGMERTAKYVDGTMW